MDWIRQASSRQRRLGLLLLVAALLVSGTLLMLQTARGPGLEIDSVTYVSGSKILQHNPARFYNLAGSDKIGDYDHFPPGYPMALAVTRWLGFGLLNGARFLGLLSLVATLGLLFFLVGRATSPVVGGAACLTLILLTSFVSETYAWVMSDGLFIPFVLLTVLLVENALRSDRDGRSWWLNLVLIGVVAGAAAMERIVGVSLVAFAGLAMLLLARRQRVLSAIVVGLPAAAIVLPWFVANWLNRDTGPDAAPGARILWHPPGRARAHELGQAFGQWFVPLKVADKAAPLTGAVVLAAVAFAVYVLVRTRWSSLEGRDRTVRLLLLVVLSFLSVLFVATSIYNPEPNTDQRNLAMVPVIVVAVLALVAFDLWQRGVAPRALKVAAVFAAVAMASAAIGTARDTKDARAQGLGYRNGLGYTSPYWQSSPTLRYVKTLPKSTLIYTNAQDVIYLTQDRVTVRMPKSCAHPVNDLHPGKGRCIADRPSFDFHNEIAKMADQLRQHHGLLVYINKSERSTDATHKDMDLVTKWVVVRTFADGEILQPA